MSLNHLGFNNLKPLTSFSDPKVLKLHCTLEFLGKLFVILVSIAINLLLLACNYTT